MKNLCLPTLLAAVILSGAAVISNAGPLSNPALDKPATKATTKPIFNKICPINKEPVDPDCKTVEYKDKKIGFCCAGCIAEFKKDPEKYMKDLK